MEKIAQPVLTDLSPDRLAEAVEESLIATLQLFGAVGEYSEDAPAGVKRSITDLPVAQFNALAGARFAPDQAGPAIAQVIADARARDVPLTWWVGPLTQPADLGERLQAHGFLCEEMRGMAVDLDELNERQPIPAGLSLQRATDEVGWRLWADTMLRGFGATLPLPSEVEAWCDIFRAAGPEPVYAYTGWLLGRPVATCLMVLGAGVAGISCVSTLPDVRRQGIGERMTLEPLIEARRLGLRAGVLASSKMGFSVYRNLGFEEVGALCAYHWSPE